MKQAYPQSTTGNAFTTAGVKKLSRRAFRMAPEAMFRVSAAALSLFALFGFNPQTLANTYTKTNTAGALNTAASYVANSGVPGSGDIILFNNTITGAQSDTLGGSFTVGELQVTNPGGAITIGADTALYVLTVNGVANSSGVNVGIDMSAATQNLTYGGANDSLAVGAAQSWLVNAGRTLTISGILTGTQNVTIGSAASATGGNVTLNSVADQFSGNFIVNSGTLTLTTAQSATEGVSLANGTTVSSGVAWNNAITVLSGTATDSAGNFSGTLLGSGNILLKPGMNGSYANGALLQGYGGVASMSNFEKGQNFNNSLFATVNNRWFPGQKRGKPDYRRALRHRWIEC
jgi:hypothetical protein